MSTSVISKTVTVIETVTEELSVALDNTNVEELIVAFADVKQAIKTLKEKQSEIDASLRALLGDAKIGTLNGVKRVEIVDRTREGLDMDLLKELHPDVILECGKTTQYTELRAK